MSRGGALGGGRWVGGAGAGLARELPAARGPEAEMPVGVQSVVADLGRPQEQVRARGP